MIDGGRDEVVSNSLWEAVVVLFSPLLVSQPDPIYGDEPLSFCVRGLKPCGSQQISAETKPALELGLAGVSLSLPEGQDVWRLLSFYITSHFISVGLVSLYFGLPSDLTVVCWSTNIICTQKHCSLHRQQTNTCSLLRTIAMNWVTNVEPTYTNSFRCFLLIFI